MENTYPHDPWNQDSYETGSTKPPKSKGGAIALLLIAVIFLGGISSVLGIMNIKLFRQLRENGNSDMSFFTPADTKGSETATEDPTDSPNTSDVTVDLNKTPEGVENIPQQGGLSLQKIYDKNIASTVSITCDTGSGTGVTAISSPTATSSTVQKPFRWYSPTRRSFLPGSLARMPLRIWRCCTCKPAT